MGYDHGKSDKQKALILQGGATLRAYEARMLEVVARS
jgi:hypothetical protein